MDVRTEMLVFPGFRGPDRSFCPRTSAVISTWTSAGYPAPKLALCAAFSFLRIGAHGKRSLERGLAEQVGKGLAKGWRRVGTGLAKGWQRVSGLPCTLQFCSSRSARLEERVCDPMDKAYENTTHPKTQKTDRPENQRFRLCCILGCIWRLLEGNKVHPKTQDTRTRKFSGAVNFLHFRVCCVFRVLLVLP